MKSRYLILSLLLIFSVGFISYRVTLALFSDSAQSQDNTFTAAPEFFTSPTPTSTPTPTPTPDLSGIANHVVISEVQINGGPGDAEHDFIELYNPTSVPFDLNGHRLVKRAGNSSTDDTIKSWTASAMIPAHGFYLWASSGDPTFPVTIGADTSTTDELTSSNSIALRNGVENTGIIVDALSWNDGSTLGEGNEFDPDPGGDQSIERKALSTSTAPTMAIGGADEFKGNGFDLNDNATDFILRTVSEPQNSSSGTESP